MFNLLGKQYSDEDDIIWKLEKNKIIFYKNESFLAEISLGDLVLKFVVSEMERS